MLPFHHPCFLVPLAVLVLSKIGNCHGVGSAAASSLPSSYTHTPTTFQLTSGSSIPLLGMGIGNLPHEEITQVIHNQLDAGVRLIDTAHASNNEHILAEAVASYDVRGGALRGGGGVGLDPIHVVTKVWYTHLGYERTKISVEESLANLQLSSSGSHRQIFVHMLLHWPRCNNDIPWMNCEEEEMNLPQRIKDAGPPPHLNKENAFIDSWKALEDMFQQHQHILHTTKGGNSPLIASIGVSNFDLDDMKRLLQTAKIPPHIYQGNAWAVFHDPYLMNYLREHGIFFQAYAVITGILKGRNAFSNSYNILSRISRELHATINAENKDSVITEATVVLAYFIHHNIGVIPRAASSSHQRENSGHAVHSISPHLTEAHMQDLHLAIPALMKDDSNDKPPVVSVSFMNSLTSPIQVHWIQPETEKEILVSEIIHPGSVDVHGSHPGHRFVAYDPDRTIKKEFVVDANYGESQHFYVEL